MKYIKENDIDDHVTEPDLHQQNPAEGVIREVRRKWYRVMIRKRVPTRLWDYGMRWVSGIMAQTHTLAGEINGCTPLCRVTGKTVDISEYLDFGFYDQVWFHDDVDLGQQRPGRWLGVTERQGNLMC